MKDKAVYVLEDIENQFSTLLLLSILSLKISKKLSGSKLCAFYWMETLLRK